MSKPKLYGLIGYPLSHSFSKRYFGEKFERENIFDCSYELFPLEKIEELEPLLKTENLVGLNVTIPYKLDVIPYLDDLDPRTAARIGAVNTIRIYPDGSTRGYNTDYYGFKNSLEDWLDHRGEDKNSLRALVLGTGGSSKAVTTALEDLQIPFTQVSRSAGENLLTYEEINAEVLEAHRLIVNTTPLGMSPNTEVAPPIPYEHLTARHYLYDLIYNPGETLFLRKGSEKGAATMNGLTMLHLQAEKSWSIWNEEERLS